VSVNLWFEPADENDLKFLGWVNVTVNEARDLAAADSYVKLYLLHKGKSVRSSKLKTKVVKKSHQPIFEQRFRLPVTRACSLSADTALEISIWNYARLQSNEVLGAVLFHLEELASTTSTSGWFPLKAYHDVRQSAATAAATVTSGPPAAAGSDAARRGSLGIPASGTGARTVSSASHEDLALGTGGSDADADGKRNRKRALPAAKNSKSQLLTQVDELRAQVRRLEASEERHVQEKALLEEKLQALRESSGASASLRKKNAEMMQELDLLRQTRSSQADLLERIEVLEEENFRLQQQLKLLNGDRERHTDEICVLRDRYGARCSLAAGWRPAFLTPRLRPLVAA
jgi:hypothetical protein